MQRLCRSTITNTQLGLTLVESLVTILIVGIISAVSIVNYLSVVRNQRLSAAAINTAQWLDSIRKRSMQQNQRCSISVNVDNRIMSPGTLNKCGSFASFLFADTSTDTRDLRLCFRVINPLDPNTTLGCSQSTTNISSEITFSPRGTIGSNFAIEFYSTGEAAKACTIILSPTGIIRSGHIQNGYCKAPG